MDQGCDAAPDAIARTGFAKVASADEKFLSGEDTKGNDSLRQVVKDIVAKVDTNGDRQISADEWKQYLSSLPPETMLALTTSLRNIEAETRRHLVRRVFEALGTRERMRVPPRPADASARTDTNKDGRVDREEIMFWLSNEASWKHSSGKRGLSQHEKEAIFARLDKNHSNDVSIDELGVFLQDYKLRDLRRFTEDQIYYDELAKYAANPTEEARERVRQLKENRKFAKEVSKEADGAKD